MYCKDLSFANQTATEYRVQVTFVANSPFCGGVRTPVQHWYIIANNEQQAIERGIAKSVEYCKFNGLTDMGHVEAHLS